MDAMHENSMLENPGLSLTLKTRNPFLVVLAILASFAAIFLLPYLFPVEPSTSDSYLVGFNNHVSFVAFVLCISALAWWTKGFGITAKGLDTSTAGAGPSTLLLYTTITCFVFLQTTLWALVHAHPAMDEAMYFLDRLQHLNHGELLYSQFEFGYGPFLLYFPFAITHLFHVSLATGYYSAWILGYIAGIILIYFCVRLLPSSIASKNAIFIMLAGAWWAPAFNFGFNYSPLRFFLAPFLCIVAARRISSSRASVKTAVELLAAEASLLLLSAEHAIAFCAAVTAFLLLSYIQTRLQRYLNLLAAFAGGCGVLIAIGVYANIFQTMRTVSHGGLNFPLVPVLSQLPIVWLVFVSVAVLIDALRTRRPVGVIELLILCGVFTLPAAFGRTDFGHILVNTTSAILAGFVILARYPQPFARTVLIYTLLVLLLPVLFALPGSIYDIRTDRNIKIASLPPIYSGSEIFTSTAVQKPQPLALFGHYVMNFSDTFVSGDAGYYFGFVNDALPSQTQKKLEELRSSPNRDILVPHNFSCIIKLDRQSLMDTLWTSHIPVAKRTSDIHEPLCRYIRQHYRPSLPQEDFNGLEIWIPASQ